MQPHKINDVFDVYCFYLLISYTVRSLSLPSSASSSNSQYHLFSLRSSSICLRLLPRLLSPSIFPSIFHSIGCLRRPVPTQEATNGVSVPSFCCMQDDPFFLDSMQHLFISHTIGLTDFSILLQHHISNPQTYLLSNFRSVQFSSPYNALFQMQQNKINIYPIGEILLQFEQSFLVLVEE